MSWRPPWLPVVSRPSSMGAWADEQRALLDEAELAPADDEDDARVDDTTEDE